MTDKTRRKIRIWEQRHEALLRAAAHLRVLSNSGEPDEYTRLADQLEERALKVEDLLAKVTT